MKRLWYQYDLSFPADGKWLTAYATRYCGFRGKDPVETLKLIPIKVLHNFLHWILQEERDAAYGELTADILEYILSGTEERDRLSPD